MVFNSFLFWFFFLVTISIYRYSSHKVQNRILLVASYIFYGYWDYRFLLLIALSTVVDYVCALGISQSKTSRKKKLYLIFSLSFNLGILGFFKYWGFFVDQFSVLLSNMGVDYLAPSLHIILPVGISFYTFQTMSYTIDVYRGVTKPADNLWDFALYVSFFPQLVAGPIERSSHLLPQVLRVRKKLSEDDFSEGLFLVISGLFKKVVIADNMAPIVNFVFSKSATDLTGVEIIVGVYAFAFQIYGDFSGYSSIAKGLAKWMGFDLMWNFKNPYFATSPSDFWKRWHISLSSWLRDYLYIPLGGNRHGKTRTFRNLMTTMALGGLWHGAGWTYIAWGIYHGFLLIIYQVYESVRSSLKISESKSRKVVAMVLFFQLIAISWLLFRAVSFDQATSFMMKIFTDHEVTQFAVFGGAMIIFYCLPLMAYEYWTERARDMLILDKSNIYVRASAYAYMVMMMIVFQPLMDQQFIYFQF